MPTYTYDIEESIPLTQSVQRPTRKINPKLVSGILALLASAALLMTYAAPKREHKLMESNFMLGKGVSIVEFSTGPKIDTEKVISGDIRVLADKTLNVDCKHNALVGFNLVNTKEKDAEYIHYEYHWYI